MTRRELARLAAAGAYMPAAVAQQKYTGPLDGLEDKVDAPGFDPVRYTLKLYDSAPLRMTFRAENRKQAEAWQRQLRTKIAELLGGFPAQKPELKPQTLEVREFPAYRREKFVFQSRPGVWVLGYLLTPAKGKAPYPAMVCVPGHGRGVDELGAVGREQHRVHPSRRSGPPSLRPLFIASLSRFARL
jgi:hypothetical protein